MSWKLNLNLPKKGIEHISEQSTNKNMSKEMKDHIELHHTYIEAALPMVQTYPEPLKIKVKYHDPECKISKIDIGNWIDLKTAEDVEMKAGDFRLISLGISMELPEGYEANIVPRSSTFKNFGVLQANSFGVVDNSYCGNDDVWKFPAYARKKITIPKGTRICQFRINQVMKNDIELIEVESLDGKNRGGFGSTGTK